MLSYRAFKHTNTYTKLQHLILYVFWLVLEQKDSGRAAEFIYLVKLVHLFNFLHFLSLKLVKFWEKKTQVDWIPCEF